jgi:prepilin-type N-terminal cleavage/methylation domain-containing protein
MRKSSCISTRMSDRTRGFTLIELLVVIAIIAVLAGLLMAVIGKVRQSGYQAKSISNLRQLSVAASTYAGEHDGWFPADVVPRGDGTFWGYWRLNPEFTKYLGEENPGWVVTPGSVMRSGYNAAPDPANPGSGTIGYNNSDAAFFMLATPPWMSERRALQNVNIARPARLILFAESVSSIISMPGRDAWVPEMDKGGGGGKYGVTAYRAAGNTKTNAITYGGNLLMIDRPAVGAAATRADYEIWRNYWPTVVPAN